MSSEQLVDGSDDELLQQHKPHQHHLHEHRAPVEDMQVEDEASGSVIRSVRPQSRSTSRPRSLTSERKQGGMEPRLPLGIGRRTLGIILLLIVVVLWTVSNFLASVSSFLLAFFIYTYFFQNGTPVVPPFFVPG